MPAPSLFDRDGAALTQPATTDDDPGSTTSDESQESPPMSEEQPATAPAPKHSPLPAPKHSRQKVKMWEAKEMNAVYRSLREDAAKDSPKNLQQLPLDAIRIDGDTQPREAVDTDTVTEYAERMLAGDAFPPLEVYFDGSHYWLWDGYHRLHAALKAGRAEFPCHVATGTADDARWQCLAANKANALKRTNADKRRAVELALERKPDLSDRAIADHVGVDHKTVGAARASTGEIPQSVRTGRDGRTIKTAGIGKTHASARELLAPPVDAREALARIEAARAAMPSDVVQRLREAEAGQSTVPTQALAPTPLPAESAPETEGEEPAAAETFTPASPPLFYSPLALEDLGPPAGLLSLEECARTDYDDETDEDIAEDIEPLDALVRRSNESGEDIVALARRESLTLETVAEALVRLRILKNNAKADPKSGLATLVRKMTPFPNEAADLVREAQEHFQQLYPETREAFVRWCLDNLGSMQLGNRLRKQGDFSAEEAQRHIKADESAALRKAAKSDTGTSA